MKALLYQAIEQAPSSEVVDPEVTARFQAQFDEQWFQYCEKELIKINTFYNGSKRSSSLCISLRFHLTFT